MKKTTRFGPKKWFERTHLFVRQLTKSSVSKMWDMPRKSKQILIFKAKTTTIEFNCASKILDITRIIVRFVSKKSDIESSSCQTFVSKTVDILDRFWAYFHRPVYDFCSHVVKSPRLGDRGYPPLSKNPVSACWERSVFYMVSALPIGICCELFDSSWLKPENFTD